MSDKALIELKNIHKTFPGVYALQDVSLDVMSGEVHGLVGENGAGKSTLIKVIAGMHKPNQGQYLVDGVDANINTTSDAIKKGIAVVYQELNVVDSMSIAENVFYGRLPTNAIGIVNWKKLYEETSSVLSRIGLDLDPKRKVGFLSIAQKQMVEIAKVLSENPRVVIMDEPTSALSKSEINILYDVVRALQAQGVGIVYISHKLDEIFELASRITVLRDGKLVDCVKTAETTESDLIGMMVGRSLDDMFERSKCSIGEMRLEVEGITTDKVKDISFTVKAGEIVGFSGLMGAGRTELARAIFGVDKREKGTIKLNGKELKASNPSVAVKCGLGLVPESRKDEGILPNFSVRKNISISSLRQYLNFIHLSKEKEDIVSKKMVESMLVKTPSLEQLIVNLSGGNQQKVIIGRWLAKDDLQVLIVDEPTRGVDVGAKSEIYTLLENLAMEGLAIIIMSSEMPELLGLCDKIYVMKGGRVTGSFDNCDANQENLLAKAMG